VEVCCSCGMMYYDATVLKKIEKHFLAIQRKEEQPDSYIELPQLAYA
jgi:hypothetical protein